MSGIMNLIAASHKKMDSGRKQKIINHVKKQTPKAQHQTVQKVANRVLDKAESIDKDDKTLAAQIKAAVQGSFMVTSSVGKLIEAAGVATSVYTLSVNDQDGSLWKILEYIKKCGDDGHSISFKIDDQSFGFDGDGGDKIVTMDRDEAP